MIDEDDEFTDGDEFEELSASVLADGGKKCTIFLVDASPKMFEKYKSVDSESDCSFRRALKIVRLQMVNKAVTSAFGEYTCCILLNTVIFSALILTLVNLGLLVVAKSLESHCIRNETEHWMFLEWHALKIE
ncbi:unnamed protein product, partial [Brugia timori]|uniref:Ku_N domain-containing protein n=1 Tax=Brugia timori TaxID=42155 RepID=A0A0R3QJ20_9BILA